MKTYTTDIHAKRLVKMLQRKNPCGCCPGGMYYRGDGLELFRYKNSPCDACRPFVGIVGHTRCPCHIYGEATAIKKTIAALKKGGYL